MKLNEIIPLTAGKIELIDNETLETIGVFEDKYYYRTKFEKEHGDREVVMMIAEQDVERIRNDFSKPWFEMKLTHTNNYEVMSIYLGEEKAK